MHLLNSKANRQTMAYSTSYIVSMGNRHVSGRCQPLHGTGCWCCCCWRWWWRQWV